MSTASGKNDGSVQGTRYFTVAPLHGLFVRSSIVAKATNKNAPGPSVANSSKHISDSSGADPSTRGTSPSAVGHASSGQAPAVREALAALTAVSPTASPPVRPAADSRPETPPNLNHIHNPFALPGRRRVATSSPETTPSTSPSAYMVSYMSNLYLNLNLAPSVDLTH
jgi:dynactin 1